LIFERRNKMKKTKAMLEEELKQKSTEIEYLKKELEKVERYMQYDDLAGELKAVYDSFVNAGFKEEQAFTLMTLVIQNQISNNSRSYTYRPYSKR
jgi:predicted nuclease with TOPRIM domain